MNNDINMYLKYFFTVISLGFLIQCTNAPSDLSKYEKFLFFDEITMSAVGMPTLDQVKDKEFVYVKKIKNDFITVYYPYKDVLINYEYKDSLWTREYIKEYKETAEKYTTIFFSMGDSIYIEYVQDFEKEQCPYCNLWFSQKGFSILIKTDCGIIWTKEKLRDIIKEQVKVEKFKNLEADEVLIRKYYVDNYILYYFIEKGKKNGKLSYAINRSKTPPRDDSDTDTEIFLTKYPEYKYKTNLRVF